jgi:Phage tail tube protein
MGVAIAGTAFLFTNGAPIALRGNLTISPGRVERTGLAGQDRVHGYQELPTVPFIEADISLDPTINWEDVELVVDATIQADLINGHSYVLRNAWKAGRIEMNTREGFARCRWEGMNCSEMTS